jgi:glycosyltransferase involved in cell wall biosynthesis
MKKTKVCYIITKLELGGAQQVVLSLLRALDRTRFEPMLITGTGGLLDSEAQAINDCKVYFLPALLRQINPFAEVAAFFRMCSILRREKPDVVHTHSSKAGILGRCAAFVCGVPVIVHTIHGFGFHDYQSPFIKQVFIWLERITAACTDCLIAVSRKNVDKGLQHAIGVEQQYTVIRPGVDLNEVVSSAAKQQNIRAELSLPSDVPVITTIGPFKPQKNLIDFVKLAAMVNAKTRAQFLIVGDGILRPEIEECIHQLQCESKTTLLGWRNDVPAVLAGTTIFVMTSLWEGLPRSIVEAMCLGLPVVANAVDGVQEIVRHNVTGYLVTPHSLTEMADHIIYLINNPEQAKTMGAAGKNMISTEYDTPTMVKQHEALYESLLS